MILGLTEAQCALWVFEVAHQCLMFPQRVDNFVQGEIGRQEAFAFEQGGVSENSFDEIAAVGYLQRSRSALINRKSS